MTATARVMDNESRRAEYERWLANGWAERGNASFLPPTLDEYCAGNLTGRVRISGAVYGVQGVEHHYSLESWHLRGFEWADEAAQLEKALDSGAVRSAWISSKEPGTGKTGWVISYLKRRCKWTTRAEIIRIPRCNTTPFAELNTMVVQVQGRDIVVLDDIHRLRFSAEPMQQWFHALADALYIGGKSVIVTANASMAAVAKAAGEEYHASFDRLREGGLMQVKAEGTSKRG